jgi:hypothetical protein
MGLGLFPLIRSRRESFSDARASRQGAELAMCIALSGQRNDLPMLAPSGIADGVTVALCSDWITC